MPEPATYYERNKTGLDKLERAMWASPPETLLGPGDVCARAAKALERPVSAANLKYLLASREELEPALRVGGRRVFTEAECAAVIEMFGDLRGR